MQVFNAMLDIKKITYLLLVLIAFTASTPYASNLKQHRSPDEENTIAVFQRAAPYVIYVHRINRFQTGFFEQVDVPSGAGSGIIWDNKGHIVTNYHVVKGADTILVSFKDKTLKATLIGAEPRKDLAVLRVDAPYELGLSKTFTPFETVKTQSLVVGQKTLAIGNPFGLDHSLTTGVISALGREIPSMEGVNIKNMIQTDASINPGNSGGPLLDSQGRLIGLNTLIYSKSGSSSGVGFAVPAETLSYLVPQLIQYGHIKLSGIGIIPLEGNISQYFSQESGLFIGKVLPNSPAEAAGLVGTQVDPYGRVILGDAILAINQHKISDYNDMYHTLSHIPIGETITVHISRHGKTHALKMKTMDISHAPSMNLS